MVDFEIKFWIKLILNHTSVPDKAVVRKTLNRVSIKQRNLRIAFGIRSSDYMLLYDERNSLTDSLQASDEQSSSKKPLTERPESNVRVHGG